MVVLVLQYHHILVQPQENNVQVFVLDCMPISLPNTPASRLSSIRSTCRMQNCAFILNEA